MAIEVNMPTLHDKSVLIEDRKVRILDRRVFPLQVEYVECSAVEEVAVAIENMVTQSGGPYYAASAGLVLAAAAAEPLSGRDARQACFERAARRLIATRPTNNMILTAVSRVMDSVPGILDRDDLVAATEHLVLDLWAEHRAQGVFLGEHAAGLIADGDTILTHCWGESTIMETVAAALRQGKKFQVMCSETRPYLQGSRLTAHSVGEMGVAVTVITDNMGAAAMDAGKVSRLMTAADRITGAGHVVNKVGTLQLAIAARHFGIPFTAMVKRPDFTAMTPADVPMEMRDPDEVLHCLGRRTASPLAQGWYPAFDVTPPELVTNIATCEGVFAPGALRAGHRVGCAGADNG